MRNRIFVLLALIIFTVACDSGTKNNGGIDGNQEMMGDPIYSTERDDVEANGIIEFSGKDEIYFSFTDGEAIECDQGSDSWDLKLSGWHIFTNGGISGDHAGGGVPMKADHYNDISAVNVPGMAFTDNYGSVFDNWYDADMVNSFTISTKGFVYLVKKEERVYKVTVVSYYADVQGSPVSGMYTIKVADMDDPEKITTVEEINATAGGTEAKGDGAYYSFTDGILEMTDEEAVDSVEWDMKFKRFNINLNSGVSGSGNVKGYKLDKKEFESVSSADIPDDSKFEEDRIRPIIDRWAVYNEGELLFTDYYYIIRTGNGASWFKFYLLEVVNPSQSGYNTIKFRFDKLK